MDEHELHEQVEFPVGIEVPEEIEERLKTAGTDDEVLELDE